MANTLRTTALLAVLTGLLMAAGGAMGGQGGMAMAFVFAIAMNFGSWWFSHKLVLRMQGARQVSPAEEPGLYRLLENLRIKAGLPETPDLYVIETESLNAFATGRNPSNAAVAVTRGLQRLLSEEELEGVLAHELAHVKNRDTLTSAIAASLAGAILMIANMAKWGMMFGGFSRDDREEGGLLEMLALALIAPIAATVVQAAISRSREFAADAAAASFTGSPMGLASALAKLETANERMPLAASPATAHLFIVNPLAGASLARLFSTHPPTEARIEALRALSGRVA